MELKNAVAVCLISLVSATLVALIARSLDSQAAAQLEPRLEQIAKELEAIRKGGGIAAPSGEAAATVKNGLVVYYFHGNMRCPTCRSIESQAHETVQADFASELDGGKIVWKILNYEKPAGEPLGKKFEVIQPVVVLARMKDGETADWKRLDRVWALEGDKPAFREFLRGQIAAMLEGGSQPAGMAEVAAPAAVPKPDTPLPAAAPADEAPPPLPILLVPSP
jgi:hypothetical protein